MMFSVSHGDRFLLLPVYMLTTFQCKFDSVICEAVSQVISHHLPAVSLCQHPSLYMTNMKVFSFNIQLLDLMWLCLGCL